MTSTQIVEHLAKEFSTSAECVRNTLEMIDAGLAAPFIGRVRRTATGGLSESYVRRMARMREELEELDRRRGTILRMLEGPETTSAARAKADAEPAPAADASATAAAAPEEGERVEAPAARELTKAQRAAIGRVRACMDRFELEDLFLPHRRPEPEVQLALDRGLGALADEFVRSRPAPPRSPESGDGSTDAPTEDPAEDSAGEAPAAAEAAAPAPEAPTAEATEAAEHTGEDETAGATGDDEDTGGAGTPEVAAESGSSEEAAAAADSGKGGEARPNKETAAAKAREEALLHGQIEVTPALARVCAAHVSPDRGVHTESDALAGAMRILSDRLGRDTRLRVAIRKLFRKHGVLSVRQTVEDSKLGRHRPLLKIKQALKQVQGHRLLAIRQAQKERVLTTAISLPRKVALPKVRGVLGKHTEPEFDSVLDAVAIRTLEHRLLPVLEADVRLELKERADEEALRFLSQHLRQVLLAPPMAHQPVAGIDVNAKGDWTVVALDAAGEPLGEPTRIEVGEKDDATLGTELRAAMDPGEDRAEHRPAAIAIGNGKGPRAGQAKLRAALAATDLRLVVYVVNEAGLSSYANSELARTEFADLSVPQRMAVSLARRLQDPLSEVLKVDPRHLGLGSEQGLVSKANLRRMFRETIDSCTAHVGCDVNRAPLSFLQHVPGLDLERAKKIVERRKETPFASRDDLRSVLDEAAWTTAAAFLRVPGSTEPLDATSLHPEQYDLVRRVLGASGSSVEESLGKPGVTKGLRRADFEIDELVWRDLVRELWHPGRDPRHRLSEPRLLDPNTDPVTLVKDRVLEGVVSNVASFGAFVDIGLAHDAMIHVSEISKRYVRDARELVSVGQTVRARIKDAGGQRIALSLKDVPDPERPARGPRGERRGAAGGGRGERRGPRRGGPDRERPQVPVRAAQSRRDGMGGSGRPDRDGRRGGRGPGGGRGGPGRGPGRGGRRGERDDFRPEDLESVTKKAAYNPFATFFQEQGTEGEGGES